MAYTLEQLNALESALALGATSVNYGGNSVTYRSLDEMRSLRLEMRRDLGLVKSKTFVNPSVSKGLNRRRGRC